ncbi:MAG: polyprenyl diphosphate synthase [Patescibacteria group bacterium]
MIDKITTVKQIPIDRFPKNILIIPDGNGRWAKEHGKNVTVGHRVAAERIRDILEDLKDIDQIETITLWAFSSDNWVRDKKEIKGIMLILEYMITRLEKRLIEERTRFIHIGRKDRIPEKLLHVISMVEEHTKSFNGRILSLAIDFGGEDQLMRVIEKARNLDRNIEIDKSTFYAFKDGGSLVPSSDLIIRTSGERRISDIGWFNGKGTELYFEPKYFPDVKTNDILDAILDFSKRERRMGGRK